MTRSGAAAAAARATAANGHSFESLQAWNTLSAVLIRQPVSPMTTIRCGFALGNGSARPRIDARATPWGMALSQTSTGNAEGFESAGSLRVGRSGIVAGRARTSIATATPSSSIVGTARERRDRARDGAALLAQQHERVRPRRARAPRRAAARRSPRASPRASRRSRCRLIASLPTSIARRRAPRRPPCLRAARAVRGASA